MSDPKLPVPDTHPDTTIRSVNWPEDLDTVRGLLQDYREWINEHRDPADSRDPEVPVGLRELDQLISELPGAYGPPRGEVLLAFDKDGLAACGALREVGPNVGEIRRVYIRADHRGPGFGHRFTMAMVDRARELGYERVRSYTLPTMYAAIQFYQDLGFRPIPAYWQHPVRGVLFFEYEFPKSPSAKGKSRTSKSKKSSK
jgi:putative acetyltransferase